ILKVIDFLRENSVPILQVNLLPYHELGQDKLEKLGKARHDTNFTPPSNEHLNELVQLFKQNGYQNTRIGG
ncbi:MAG: glycyl-radical enzyme activating protein, partial [Clostridia bacterium]|nr:glycyl-radical enzyme activating protein [Clostridia bacterium]